MVKIQEIEKLEEEEFVQNNGSEENRSRFLSFQRPYKKPKTEQEKVYNTPFWSSNEFC